MWAYGCASGQVSTNEAKTLARNVGLPFCKYRRVNRRSFCADGIRASARGKGCIVVVHIGALGIEELVGRATLRLQITDFCARPVGRAQLVFDEPALAEVVLDSLVLLCNLLLRDEQRGVVGILNRSGLHN